MLIIKKVKVAREHKDWTTEQWMKVIWSIESRFTPVQTAGCIRVRGDADEVLEPSCWLPTGHSGGGIWSGVAAVAQVQVIMFLKKEVSWLPEDSEWPAYSIKVFFFPDDMGIFQKDNVWIHQAQIVKECPTLNLSENLWDVLEKLGPMLQLSHHQYKILGTVQKLMEAIPQQIHT